MRLKRQYNRVRFSEEAIREAVRKFEEKFNTSQNLETDCLHYSVQQGRDSWSFDSEDEFFLVYSSGDEASFYWRLYLKNSSESEVASGTKSAEINIHHLGRKIGLTNVDVNIEQKEMTPGLRNEILEVFQVLDKYEVQCRLPDDSAKVNSKPLIFIGHGHSEIWRKLKDHLTDKHGYPVVAYETGARAGHTIRDILQSMLEHSSFALLVLTKEDETADSQMRARQNVVHETGLFQGKLGFSRAIVLLEEGTEDFSNIRGIEQVRFNTIEETFGDVVATLKREFG